MPVRLGPFYACRAVVFTKAGRSSRSPLGELSEGGLEVFDLGSARPRGRELPFILSVSRSARVTSALRFSPDNRQPLTDNC